MNRFNLPLQTRAATLEELRSGDERTFNVVFTTGAIVRRYNFFTDEAYDEELVVDPSAVRLGRLNSGAAPVLDTHGDLSLSGVLGVVLASSAYVDGSTGKAAIKLDGGPENDPIIRKIKDGITRDEVDTQRSLITNALLNRHNPKQYPLEDRAREYRGLSLLEIGRDILERRGVRTRGMSRSELAGAMLGMETRAGFHGTTDFPLILANVANKTLRAAYEAAPQTFKSFCRQTTNPDFKTIARTQLGDAPSLEKVNESGEFKYGTVGEAREQYALATYGKVVAITRQTIINDDLGAFTRLPEMFGRAAADLESDTVWGIITSNPNMGDSVALFHANHGNLAGAGTAITVASLGDGRANMRKQKGLNGRFINVMAKYLVVPASLETVAEQYVTQTNIVYTKSTDYNPFANKLQVVAEPRLDAASLISWYLAADPAQIDTIEYAYLEGQEGVYLESRTGFEVDGVELKARLDFAAKAIDWRGFWRNPGA